MSKWSSWIFTDESQLYGVTFPTKQLAMHLIFIWILHLKKEIKITIFKEGNL